MVTHSRIRRTLRRNPPVGGWRRRRAALSLLVAVLAALLIWLVLRPQPKRAIVRTVPVTAAAVGRANVPVEIRSFGTVSPMNSVAIKSRVAGNLVSIHFTEGQTVARGQLLFTIDPRPLQAQVQGAQADVEKQQAVITQAHAAIEKDEAGVQQARANLNKDIAQQRNAIVEANRYLSLVKQGAVSLEQYQQYQTNALAQEAVVASDRAAIKNAQATVQADRANLKSAQAQAASSVAALKNLQVQLGYTSITSPIAGKTGVIQVLLGNDVKPDQDVLVTVNQLAPIYVTFSVPQSEFPQVRLYDSAGTLSASAYMPNGSILAQGGAVTLVDNTVDPATGTVKIKAVFGNGAGKLWPGQYVNVLLTLTVLNNTIVVPTQAVQAGQQGQFVWVIKPDKTAYMQSVTTGPTAHGVTAVRSGLVPGQMVVTDGQLQLSEGVHVRIVQRGART